MTILKTSILYKLNLVGTNDNKTSSTIRNYNGAFYTAQGVILDNQLDKVSPSQLMRVIKDLAISTKEFTYLLYGGETYERLCTLASNMEIREFDDCSSYLFSQVIDDMDERCDKLLVLVSMYEYFEQPKEINSIDELFKRIPQLEELEEIVAQLDELACRLDYLYEERVNVND